MSNWTDSVANLVMARSDDDAVGLRFEDESWTWREVVANAANRAALLKGLELETPFHIGVLLENTPEFLFVLLGAALAGGVVAGVNPTRRGPELAGDIRHADCRVLIVDPNQVSLVDGLDLALKPDRIFVTGSSEYLELIKAKSGATLPDIESLPTPDDLFLLLFTSGSTGAPKAVKATQGRMASAANSMAKGSGFSGEDVLYCAMPMFHGNALSSCVLPAVAAGSTLVLRRKFSASGFGPDIRRYGVTFFNYVGRALAYIVASPQSPDDAENRLKFAFGSEASPADMVAFKRRFGCPVVEGYGSSEGGLAMTRGPGTPKTALGRPPVGYDTAIVNEAGEEKVPAEFDEHGRIVNSEAAVGEIVVRGGASRFEGYYANDEANEQRTRNGWFWTGDLGYKDSEGFFYFAGRPSDWLRVDGENFAAAPVERILARYPGVLNVAVYPVPDATTGDQVMATLEFEDSSRSFDPEGFAAFLVEQADLGTKWAPRYLRVGMVPLTPTAKVNKQPLRSERWETKDPVWWRPTTELSYVPFESTEANKLRSEFAAQGRENMLDA